MSLPLTRSAPWTEIPPDAGMTLFPELAPSAARPVQVTVTVSDEGGRRPVMDIVASEDDAPQAFAMAFGACRDTGEFEVVARRFRG